MGVVAGSSSEMLTERDKAEKEDITQAFKAALNKTYCGMRQVPAPSRHNRAQSSTTFFQCVYPWDWPWKRDGKNGWWKGRLEESSEKRKPKKSIPEDSFVIEKMVLLSFSVSWSSPGDFSCLWAGGPLKAWSWPTRRCPLSLASLAHGLCAARLCPSRKVQIFFIRLSIARCHSRPGRPPHYVPPVKWCSTKMDEAWRPVDVGQMSNVNRND